MPGKSSKVSRQGKKGGGDGKGEAPSSAPAPTPAVDGGAMGDAGAVDRSVKNVPIKVNTIRPPEYKPNVENFLLKRGRGGLYFPFPYSWVRYAAGEVGVTGQGDRLVHGNPFAPLECDVLAKSTETRERKVTLHIKQTYNLRPMTETSMVFVNVEHQEEVVATSEAVPCSPDGETPIDFFVEFTWDVADPIVMDMLASNPIVIKICDASQAGPSKLIKRHPFDVSVLPIGCCNVDLLPLLSGEESFSEALIVEQDDWIMGKENVTWPKAPLLSVTLTADKPLLTKDEVDKSYILTITVESMYNPPEDLTATGAFKFSAGLRLPIVSEEYNDIVITNGSSTLENPMDNMVAWSTLNYFDGRATYTKYSLDNDYTSIQNRCSNVVLEKALEPEVPKVTWNRMRRCFLSDVGLAKLRTFLNDYETCPLEIIAIPFSKQSGKKSASSGDSHYVSYIDLATLSQPGERTCRTISQVYNFVEEDFKKLSPVPTSIFEDSGKAVSKGKKKKEDEVQESTPMTNATGDPVFIITTVHMSKPMYKRKPTADLEISFLKMMPPMPPEPQVNIRFHRELENYKECIQGLHGRLSRYYRTYISHYPDRGLKSLDKRSRPMTFMNWLSTAGHISHMMTALETALVPLSQGYLKYDPVRQGQTALKVGNVPDGEGPKYLHECVFLSDVYTYLCSMTFCALQGHIDGLPYVSINSHDRDLQQLTFFADEALEEGEIDKAKIYLSEKLQRDGKNADVLLEYAVFCLAIGEPHACLEQLWKVLAIQRKHKLGLLMAAAVLYDVGRVADADVVLQLTVRYHPHLLEAWVLLHLFNLVSDNYGGAIVALQRCYRLCRSVSCESLCHPCISRQLMVCEDVGDCRDSIFLAAANFLLKLRLVKMASLALEQEAKHVGCSISYLYGLSLMRYMAGDYALAVESLEDAIGYTGEDYKLYCLLGHCHYRLADAAKWSMAYEVVLTLDDQPGNNHLIKIRLGRWYMEEEEYDKALSMFYDDCNTCPSVTAWRSIGIVYYKVKDYDRAEMALNEANKLENRCAVTWGYLGLINLKRNKWSFFEFCYNQMLCIGLEDSTLAQEIQQNIQAMHRLYPFQRELEDTCCLRTCTCKWRFQDERNVI